MSSHPNWTELLPRLEFDLLSRANNPRAAVDEEAWDTITQFLSSRARVLTFSFSGLQTADVQDLVQNVLLKLQSLETMRRLHAARSVEGYLFVMLRNAANDLVRRRRIERVIFRSLEDTVPEEQVVEHASVQTAENASVLGDALESLHAEERKLLEMRFWRNMSIADIARETEATYSNTAVRLFRILYKLRVQLKK
jgi:RNA polymerase sigma factor (sigma-70 family)